MASLSTLLDSVEAFAATAEAGADLSFCQSRPFGGAYVLDRLWHRLNLPAIVSSLGRRGRGRPRDVAVTERVLFGLVANRALQASSKLAAADWITHDVHIDGLAEVDEDACYRAMDWLYAIGEKLQAEVFSQVANLLNLEVDLLFFDTTSTYFETEQADEPIARDQQGRPLREETSEHGGEDSGAAATREAFRTWGKSKDSRDDLPQIVIGMVVTRDGLPVRVWCWPGNTADSKLIRQVKDEMRDWPLSKIVWVADRGFASGDNGRYLRSGDHHYIIGEKLHSGSAEATAALSPAGPLPAGGREHAGRRSPCVRDRPVRDLPQPAGRNSRCHLLAQLAELIEGSDALSDYQRGELRGKIAAKPGLNRYLRTTGTGKLRVDATKIKTEANLDGKYLLRTSDPHLSAEDIALGYKQLLEVERG